MRPCSERSSSTDFQTKQLSFHFQVFNQIRYDLSERIAACAQYLGTALFPVDVITSSSIVRTLPPNRNRTDVMSFPRFFVVPRCFAMVRHQHHMRR